SVAFLGKVLNYTQDSTINGKIKWKIAAREQEKNISFMGFHTERIYTRVESTDTIKGSFVFTRDDGYLDGEEREVPVVEQGIIRADGSLDILKENDVITVKPGENEKTIVEILDNPMEVLVRDVEDLVRYRYDCNEQLASKLLGLISYKNVMQFNGKPFKYDKDVNRIINRLLKNQNHEFLWSWWDISSNTSYWMSAHILRALKVAQDAGYAVALDVKNLTRKATYKYEFQKDIHISDADLLNALATWGIGLNYTVLTGKIDSLIYKNQLIKNIRTGETKWKSGYFIQKMLMLEVKQLKGIPFAQDSLMHYKKEGILGDVNFTDDNSSYSWYHNELEANTVAYRIVKRDSVLRALVIPMQLYFLKERRKNSWNTYHSSSVIMSVLPDLLQAGAKKDQVATIKLTGKVNQELTKFPYQVELAPGEELRIEKQSGVPLYVMKYKLERVTVAKTGVDGFSIKTTLESKKSTLEAGQPVNLVVDVNVKRDASMEYVMIEVPIPGSCSYNDKRQSRGETHREYFKEKTVIFCENLKAGTHSFTIPLLPRFTGKFIQNPAQVSLMYVPVVNANTNLKVVQVE
ncbi:MAG TPA: hypothetical protein VFU05_07900, partial [Cyclobacteriaceae bacterium]|nr:hypothetical protein [Cyclobacteriaceae bacterium]